MTIKCATNTNDLVAEWDRLEAFFVVVTLSVF